MGLDPGMARRLSVAPWAGLFDELRPRPGEVARRLAGVLEKRIPFHARAHRGSKPRALEELPPAERLAPLVRALESGALGPQAVSRAVDTILTDAGADPEDVVNAFRPRSDDARRLEGRIGEVLDRAGRMEGRSPETLLRWAMGEVMRGFLGRVDPDEVRERLRQALGAAREAEDGQGPLAVAERAGRPDARGGDAA